MSSLIFFACLGRPGRRPGWHIHDSCRSREILQDLLVLLPTAIIYLWKGYLRPVQQLFKLDRYQNVPRISQKQDPQYPLAFSITLGQTFLVPSMFCDEKMLRVSPDCWGCKWSIPRSLLDLTQSYPRHLRDSGVPAWKPSSSISWT